MKFYLQNELNEKFSELPTPEEFALFVSWSDLEAGLKGLRNEIAAPVEGELSKVESITEAPVSKKNRPFIKICWFAMFLPTQQLLAILKITSYQIHFQPGRVAQSVGHLTCKSEVLGSIPGLATYLRCSFR